MTMKLHGLRQYINKAQIVASYRKSLLRNKRVKSFDYDKRDVCKVEWLNFIGYLDPHVCSVAQTKIDRSKV